MCPNGVAGLDLSVVIIRRLKHGISHKQGARRANAQRWVCGLVRGRRIFLRDICAAIFYPRVHE